MKKIIIAVLCLVIVLGGCGKAEPFYEQELSGLTVKTSFEYYFPDDSKVTCSWTNDTDKYLYYDKEFRLEKQSGENWYNVAPKNEIDFSSLSLNGIPANSSSSSLYEITEFELEEGSVYRISTYCYDGDGNYYQVYAQFTCNSEKAQEEINALMDEYLNK